MSTHGHREPEVFYAEVAIKPILEAARKVRRTQARTTVAMALEFELGIEELSRALGNLEGPCTDCGDSSGAGV